MKFAKLGAIALVSALALLGAPATAASQTCFGHEATIAGTAGDDELVGTAARDVIVAGRGRDRVRARQGNDLVCGGPGRDRLYGGRGRDLLRGGHGDDLMRAGPGDDLMADDAAVYDDRFLGGWGSDRVSWNGRRAVVANLTSGLARGHGRDVLRGIESLVGTRGRDTLIGNAGANDLKGFEGNDHIEGRGGPDLLDGGGGTDFLDGGAGKDTCRLGENFLNCEPIGFDWASAAWNDSHKGEPLDLTGYTKTFEDEFDSLSTITDGVTGSGPWYAPARPDTSLAQFLSPSETPMTFSIDTPGVLTITMQKVGTSWYSGHIQTVNNVGDGFAQRYGYFEARMAFEKAVSWPAFWLYTPKAYEGSAQARAEIDVIEAYGDKDYDGYHMAVHRHSLESGIHKGNYSGLSSTRNMAIWGWNDMFDGSFHRYGCLVTPDWIIIYLDGKEVSRFPTFPEAKLPLYMRVTLAMQNEFVANATSPTRLRVDYVRAYALPQ
jgi:beta-glucanase (GH16 family)